MAKAATDNQQATMDFAEHQRTFSTFLRLTKWGIIIVVSVLISLAAGTVGGMGLAGFILVLIVLLGLGYFIF